MARPKPRERLLTPTGIKEYREWIKLPITQLILEILKEENRIVAIPAQAMTDPQTAASLYHHRVGADAVIASIEDMENTPSVADIEATYGEVTNG